MTGKEFLQFYLDVNKDKIKDIKEIDEYFDLVKLKKEDQNKLLKEYKNNYPISITGRLINIKSSNSYSNVLIKIYRRMGYDISVHELRHTYTTNLIANGIDFKTAAMLIGDTVDMVMKVYSHVNKDMMNKARDIINTI